MRWCVVPHKRAPDFGSPRWETRKSRERSRVLARSTREYKGVAISWGRSEVTWPVCLPKWWTSVRYGRPSTKSRLSSRNGRATPERANSCPRSAVRTSERSERRCAPRFDPRRRILYSVSSRRVPGESTFVRASSPFLLYIRKVRGGR